MKKKAKEDIPKTWKGVVYKVIFYKTKELFFFIGILLIAWTITLIINPEIAMTIKNWILRK